MRPGGLSQAYGVRLLFEPRVQRIALIALLVGRPADPGVPGGRAERRRWLGYDLTFYWRAGQHLLDGQSIYAPFQLAGPYPPQGVDYEYLYPPFLAVAVAPLVALLPDATLRTGCGWPPAR